MRRIGESFKPQLFMVSLGLNDRQSVVEKGHITMENSEGYPAKYKERITALLAGAAASKARLLWVGLPAMRGAPADKDAREKNRLFTEAIAEFGVADVKYAKPWHLGDADDDKFQSYGPDLNGRMIQIRASDGEHFTPAGDLLVAAYLLPQNSCHSGGERHAALRSERRADAMRLRWAGRLGMWLAAGAAGLAGPFLIWSLLASTLRPTSLGEEPRAPVRIALTDAASTIGATTDDCGGHDPRRERRRSDPRGAAVPTGRNPRGRASGGATAGRSCASAPRRPRPRRPRTSRRWTPNRSIR